MPTITTRATHDGYRRGGQMHGTQPTTWPAGTFSRAQRALLDRDPHLVVSATAATDGTDAAGAAVPATDATDAAGAAVPATDATDSIEAVVPAAVKAALKTRSAPRKRASKTAAKGS